MKIKNTLLKIFSILFSLTFAIILINTIFFNKTYTINYSKTIMIIGPILSIITIYIIYKLLQKHPKIYETLDKYKIIIFILLIIAQITLAYLTYASYGWDCGTVINSSIDLYEGTQLQDPLYFAKYQNNIAITILFKYIYTIMGNFVTLTTQSYILLDVLFNILIIDLTAITTHAVCKKIYGPKTSLLSTLFIIPFIIFLQYIIIPYTDTLSQLFPILVLYLYLKIKEKTKPNPLLYLAMGATFTLGFYIKPTTVIIGIAILIINILNITTKNLKQKIPKLIKNAAIFLIGTILIYTSYIYTRDLTFGKYLTEQDYKDNAIPMTHFIMMGLKTTPPSYGSFNVEDCQATESLKGSKAKKEMNIKEINKRLEKYGPKGYAEFLYNKANWILSDGTFFYGYEGTFYTTSPHTTTPMAKKVQQTITEKNEIIAHIYQNFWILITIGLIFSTTKKLKNTDPEAIMKLSIIGIIMFLLIFEARSRYLINHLPFFIIIGTYGIKNIITQLDKIKLKKERK